MGPPSYMGRTPVNTFLHGHTLRREEIKCTERESYCLPAADETDLQTHFSQ